MAYVLDFIFIFLPNLLNGHLITSSPIISLVMRIYFGADGNRRYHHHLTQKMQRIQHLSNEDEQYQRAFQKAKGRSNGGMIAMMVFSLLFSLIQAVIANTLIFELVYNTTRFPTATLSIAGALNFLRKILLIVLICGVVGFIISLFNKKVNSKQMLLVSITCLILSLLCLNISEWIVDTIMP